MSDEEIVALLLQAEPRLHRVAGRYLSGHADRQDAVQECLVKAWRNRLQVIHPEYFTTWVTRILINVCLDVLRKRRRALNAFPDGVPGTDGMDRFIEYEALYAALAAAQEEEQLLIRLRYFEGYGIKEISTMTRQPVEAVRLKLSRSLRRMRRKLSA